MVKMVSPSVLSANFLQLGKDIEMLNSSSADWIHFDIMDGVFVPNISFGFPVMKAVASIAKIPLDVHFMIVHPENYIEKTAQLGAYMMTVHAEVCPDLHDIISQIHEAGMKAGVSVKPASPLSMVEDILNEVDMILIMSVEPGFGGQKFIESSLDKIRELRRMIESKGSRALIEVDGGVDNRTAPLLREAGADVLVSGSYIFKSADPIATIAGLKE